MKACDFGGRNNPKCIARESEVHPLGFQGQEGVSVSLSRGGFAVLRCAADNRVIPRRRQTYVRDRTEQNNEHNQNENDADQRRPPPEFVG
jgi:hypothetical protein